MLTSEMRIALKQRYGNSPAWAYKVDCMTPQQVYAIYHNPPKPKPANPNQISFDDFYKEKKEQN